MAENSKFVKEKKSCFSSGKLAAEVSGHDIFYAHVM